MIGKNVRMCELILGKDLQKLVEKIFAVNRERKVHSTNFNDQSSRSQCMVSVEDFRTMEDFRVVEDFTVEDF